MARLLWRVSCALFGVLLQFASASAQVSTTPSLYNPNLWYGQNSSPRCVVANGATVSVNALSCVTSPGAGGVDLDTITLTQNSVFAFPTGLPPKGNFKFGFRINHGTGPYTATFAVGYQFPSASMTSGQPALSASGTDYVWCVSEEGSPPTTVDCNSSMLAMTAVLAPPALGAAVHGSASGSVTMPGLTSQGTSGVVDLIATVNPNVSITVSSSHLTWTLRATAPTGTGFVLYEYSAPFTSALSSEVITVTNSGGSPFTTVDAFEVKNAPTSSYFDPNGALPAITTTGNPSIVTTGAINMAICGFRFNSTSSPTAGSGWTLISGANFQLTEYQVLSSPTGGLSCTIGTGSGDQNAGIGDAIQ